MKKEEMLPEIKEYWDGWAEDFSKIIKKELNSFRKEAWQRLILDNAPDKKVLKILDIGTGPGMFSILLAEKGHDVTGVDCTDAMLEKAEQNAGDYGVQVKFLKMDSHELNFPDNSFDLIVNRNVTWTLYDPEKAYKEWHRVLNVGGKALIFDANWGLFCFDDSLRKKQDIAKLNYKREFHDKDPERYPYYETTLKEIEYYKELFYSDKDRPDFDKAFLEKIGFFVDIKDNISNIVWDEAQCAMYAATPMFMISAQKKAG